ncbi:MAG: biopolymer transporter ExbD [Spirochaetaceae bacterium]|jgi:biopolymer transport protein ExbD|nr:biopolymer transporter ExbD [Spirochaetaceae bacterium]
MKYKHKNKQAVIPTNAMSDVAFLLLIFIMLVALINYRKTVDIEYAETPNALKVSDKENLEIWVNSGGAVFIDGNPAGFGTLEETINNVYLNRPDTRIHIIADRNTAFENVDSVIALLQAVEYRTVSFVVKDEKK